MRDESGPLKATLLFPKENPSSRRVPFFPWSTRPAPVSRKSRTELAVMTFKSQTSGQSLIWLAEATAPFLTASVFSQAEKPGFEIFTRYSSGN